MRCIVSLLGPPPVEPWPRKVPLAQGDQQNRRSCVIQLGLEFHAWRFGDWLLAMILGQGGGGCLSRFRICLHLYSSRWCKTRLGQV